MKTCQLPRNCWWCDSVWCVKNIHSGLVEKILSISKNNANVIMPSLSWYVLVFPKLRILRILILYLQIHGGLFFMASLSQWYCDVTQFHLIILCHISYSPSLYILVHLPACRGLRNSRSGGLSQWYCNYCWWHTIQYMINIV